MRKIIAVIFVSTFCLFVIGSGAEDKPDTSIPEAGKEYKLDGTKGGAMLYVPAGEFMMGCNVAVDKECQYDEKPYHKVDLDAFYIDKYEVTVDQYKACVNAKACTDKQVTTFDNCNYNKSDRGDHPMNCVDWNQSKAYCEYAGKRLPTEAEWEKAARGDDGRKAPWGNETASCERAVVYEHGSRCGKNSTWPVGSKPSGASPYGAMDMAGNAWEWVSDWYSINYYRNNTNNNNPKGPAIGKSRVFRGGSWFYDPDTNRPSSRSHSAPGVRYDLLGFRCAKPE